MTRFQASELGLPASDSEDCFVARHACTIDTAADVLKLCDKLCECLEQECILCAPHVHGSFSHSAAAAWVQMPSYDKTLV